MSLFQIDKLIVLAQQMRVKFWFSGPSEEILIFDRAMVKVRKHPALTAFLNMMVPKSSRRTFNNSFIVPQNIQRYFNLITRTRNKALETGYRATITWNNPKNPSKAILRDHKQKLEVRKEFLMTLNFYDSDVLVTGGNGVFLVARGMEALLLSEKPLVV